MELIARLVIAIVVVAELAVITSDKKCFDPDDKGIMFLLEIIIFLCIVG